MFAMKSMEDNLLRLKLDMVYRDLSMEEAQKRFSELVPAAAPPPPAPAAEAPKPKRKVVKAVVAKSK